MTDDTISRQAAIDALGEEPLVWHEDDAGEVAERNQWRRDVAAIKALPSAQPDVSDTNVGKICEYYDLCRNGRDEKKLREELLSAQPGWIPWDSGKSPKESGTYTVTVHDGAKRRVTYAKYQKRLKRWELTGARAYWRVLAWMPHIEPWEGR